MTANDAIQMMGVLESLQDGTYKSAERIERLTKQLIDSPDTFWDAYWDEFTADSPTRKQTQAVLHRIGPDATFADMKNALDAGTANLKQDGDAK